MRLRRILLLLVIVLAGGAVALEFAARSTARRLADALSPRAVLTYASAGIALDGSVRLRSPRLDLRGGIWQGVAQARSADLRGGGRFWLLARLFASDAPMPDDLSLVVHGLSLDARHGGNFLSGWLGTPDLALFENQGCGDDALSDKDRMRMGVEPSERVDQFGYHHDPASGALSLSMRLESTEIASWSGYAEFSGFDPARWASAGAPQKLRLRRAGVSYTDPGYFSRRNNFCAQWLGISSPEFVDRHVQATRAFLSSRGIEPSADLVSLYERLVTRGGALNLASLPDADWVPAEFEAYPRQVLLRQLNITARLDDAPPIMLRLAFSQPESPLRMARTEATATPAETDAPSAVPSEAAPVVEAPRPVLEEPLAVAQVDPARAPTVDVATTQVEAPAAVPPAKEAADTPTVTEPVAEQTNARTVASAPPPPPDSTLALVWEPGVIERLPAPEDKGRNYDVIDMAGIRSHVGRRVQLVTGGGKRVDGVVEGLQEDTLVLRVKAGRGSAKLNVPLSNIREVRLFRSR
jgi:hypothetical protein